MAKIEKNAEVEEVKTAFTPVKVKGKKVIEKEQFNDIFKFDRKGDSIQFRVDVIREQETKFGAAKFLDGVNIETGVETSIVITSNLQSYKWEDRIGSYVEITFIEYEMNPKTRNMYKVYEVAELEIEA